MKKVNMFLGLLTAAAIVFACAKEENPGANDGTQDDTQKEEVTPDEDDKDQTGGEADENAMAYFEGLEASSKNPVFTKVKGRQVSETVTRTITEESAFGEASVREVKSSRKDFVITWAQKEPYVWDDEETITAAEMTDAMSARQTYLATVKQRQDEYKASKGAGSATNKPAAEGGYDF